MLTMGSIENPVEMEKADSPPGPEAGDSERDADLQTLQEIQEHAKQIENAISNKESRFILGVLRCLLNTRRKLNSIVLGNLIKQIYPAEDREALLAFVEGAGGEIESSQTRIRSATESVLPEVDLYINLLILVRLIDTNKLEVAQRCSKALINKVLSQNRQTMDLIAAKCYFYYSRVAELTNRLDTIRPFLYARLHTATLGNYFEVQAVLINCLLRNYLHYSLYDQANTLVSECVFPEAANVNEWARFLYYLGRMKAVRSEYGDAYKHLLQAMGKAPNTAVGFKQTVQKLLVVVELLLNNIPEKQIFRKPSMRQSLRSYFLLTQAVRTGNLQRFGELLENLRHQFEQDHTYTLILRMRHNVINIALRNIGLSYSRISLEHIAKKLGLDSAKDAEIIVAKAIRDKVIDAKLDPEGVNLRSKNSTDIYCTSEPHLAFSRTIFSCLDLQTRIAKAMRYPPKANCEEFERGKERQEPEAQLPDSKMTMAKEDDDET